MEYSQTNDGNSLEERFEQLSRQNQQQNERFVKLSKTMDQRFMVMMEALKNLTQDKSKYREGEHIIEKGPELRLSVNR